MKRSTILSAVARRLTVVSVVGCLGASAFITTPARGEPALPRAQFFGVQHVRLLAGPFEDARKRDHDYLLELEPDRLLAGFREQAGLAPRKPKYGGWESQGVAGSVLGHYLSALAQMYAATGDVRLRDRAAYAVQELAACQAAHGDGYVSAIPDGKRIFDEVARGDIRSKGFDLNGGWVPWYTTHKVMAGLRDAHLYLNDARALDVLKGLSDWALRTTDALSPAQLQTMLACEHGGMNEVAADLHALSGEQKYLVLARRFNHHAVLDPLADRHDRLAGLHANTQIPKLIGAARQHELTGDAPLGTAARFFWDTVTRNHSYVTGGNSDHEHFGPPRQLAGRLSDETMETCNTHNMLKLTRRLFTWEPAVAYADYYERALFNHILASQDPASGRVAYYVPLRTGAMKTYQTQFESFSCCVGTGMENHAKYGEAIYAHDGGGIYVNLFIASEVQWAQKGLTLRQETRFPDEPTTRLIVRRAPDDDMPIHVRCPSWAAGGGFTIAVNGVVQSVAQQPGAYVTLTRKWVDGDTIDVTLPMRLRLEPMPDNPSKAAVLYGPIVLSGALGEGREPDVLPVIVRSDESADKPVERWLNPVAGQPLTFKTVAVGRPNDLTLVPFFRIHDQRHVVYWDLFTPTEWAKREADFRAEHERRQELAGRTIDTFQPGEMQPERDHAFEGDRTRTGTGPQGRKWRDATDGGHFSFTVACSPNEPVELVCTYWGSDTGGRAFDILVEGQGIATQVLSDDKPGAYFDVTYPIPAHLTKDKGSATVKFQAHPGKLAGGLFSCRVVRARLARLPLGGPGQELE